ncbi:MAG TPA: NAD(+)/NADH kinase [Candidatus Binatus sp.]|nr:NAD(+)/NADH kinase [Candidatus Binatus sp.]
MKAGERVAVKSIALYVDTERPETAAAAKAVARMASELGVSLHLPPAQASTLQVEGAVTASYPGSADLLITLGGDGTLLRAAHVAGDVPVIGVDFGRMGFLTQVERKDFERVLQRLIREGFQTEDRTALQARLLGSNRHFFALNDIFLDRSHHGNLMTLAISISGQQVADIPADGIVVASPTGSTAYFLSAGGPIMAPGLDAFGIAPINPHTLFSRPLVVSASETIQIAVPKDERGAHVYVDGKLETDVSPGSVIEIARAERPVKFVRLDKRHFFTMLERKLHWGASIKRTLE